MRTVTVKYDYEYGSYMIIADWNDTLVMHGDTIDEAIESLKHQCNKHGLWPNDK